MTTNFEVLPRDLADLRAAGRLTLSRSPITRRWRIALPEAGFEAEAPNRHLLYDKARAAALKIGLF